MPARSLPHVLLPVLLAAAGSAPCTLALAFGLRIPLSSSLSTSPSLTLIQATSPHQWSKNRHLLLPGARVRQHSRIPGPLSLFAPFGAGGGLPVVTAVTAVTPALSSSGTILVRIFFVRALAFIYGISFAIALSQNKALIGDDSITPAKRFLDQAQAMGTFKRHQRLQKRLQQQDQPTQSQTRQPMLHNMNPAKILARWIDRNERLLYWREVLWDRSDRADRPVTTLLWLAHDRNNLNLWLDQLAVNGLALSMAVLVKGAINVPIALLLYLFHRSIVAVGGPWYSYGWEPQLAELGFHALFAVPLISLNPMHPTPIPAVVQWCIRWYLFRIMMGAGLIKLKSGDRKWKDLTTMNYFYETQPVPNPLSRYFHWMPPMWHKFEVVCNHFVELVAPWLLILPGLPVPLRRAGGIIQLVFQATLITSGNLSFLNWLTMVPAILALDDAFLSRFVSSSTRAMVHSAAASSWQHVTVTREVVSLLFGLFILTLSRPVVRNLLSKNQAMNRSYDPLRLINTYGAFGTVSEEREELVISSAVHWDGPWKEYNFKAKPGNVHNPPSFLSPYHYRLDWQMWIAATSGTIDRSSSWIMAFLTKLLKQDETVLDGLMRGDPWKNSPDHPKYIRVVRYRYKYHKPVKGEKNPPYWDREEIGNFYPRNGLATLESLQDDMGTGSG